jgi:hypothetical protein
VSDVKKYTPNSIANEIMAEDAWHDSLWVRDDDYEALRAELAEAQRELEALRIERDSLEGAAIDAAIQGMVSDCIFRHVPCERKPDGYCARCHSEMYP